MPANNPEGVDVFSMGVQVRDLNLVREALKAGVQPTTAINGRHPLWVLLGSTYDQLPPGLQTGMTRQEFASRTSEIVNTLFERGVKVAEEGKYETPNQPYLADRFLLSKDVNDAATIVIHAIHETLQDGRPVYQPDLLRTVTGLFANGAVSEEDDYPAVIGQVVDSIARLHDAVRERLLHPQSPLEKQVAEAGGRVSYWVDPSARPDVAQILQQLGFGGEGVHPLLAQALDRDVSAEFTAEAQPRQPDFVSTLDKKPPRQVLDEIATDFVGLDALKTDAKRLVFRQSYDNARAGENLPPTETPNYSAAYMGYDGTGKSGFVHKQAELLVSLGLAGPNLVEITHDNTGKMAGSYTAKVMTQYFAQADIVAIELSGGPRDPAGKNLDDHILGALQSSLDERKKPPVILISGQREDVEAALENTPGIRALVNRFEAVPEPTVEQLGQALERKLAGEGGREKPNFVIEQDAKDYVVREFIEARKRLGSKGFRNMREVDAVVEKLPDALADRLFGSNESEQALTVAVDREKLLKTVTLADVKALKLRTVLGGPALMKSPGIGFHASI